MLNKEVLLLQQLSHRNIIELIAFSFDGHLFLDGQLVAQGLCYLLTEYIPYQDMVNFLRLQGRLRGDSLLLYAKMIAETVYFLHERNCVHRDLKLDNILIDEQFQIKLIDFSFGTLVDEDVKNTSILGTPKYMSPQLKASGEYIATSADVFAFGVIVFTLATGCQPWREACLEQDLNYRLFVQNKVKFWETVDFKHLLSDQLR